MRWGGGIGVGTIHVRDPKPLGCIHYVYHRGGGRGGAEEFRGVLKVFAGKREDRKGDCQFFRCHWKITYLQESSWYL